MSTGHPASMTVYQVSYTFKKPARKSKLPSSVKKEDESVFNSLVITTADPTGADVYHVARRIVLGETPHEGNDFRVLQYSRIVEAMGLVALTTWEKLDGKAPEKPGLIVEEDPEDDEDGDEGGSIPPAANLN